MAVDVVMPQMGESIFEGTITKWLKKPGDKVERDEPLFEISTDKVDTEIPSPVAGTLAEILVEEGKTVGINTVVGRISDGAASSPSGSAAPAATTAPAAVASPAPAPQATVAQSDGASHIDAAPHHGHASGRRVFDAQGAECFLLKTVQVFTFGGALMNVGSELPGPGRKILVLQIRSVVAGKRYAAQSKFFELGRVRIVVVLNFLG